MGWEGEGEGEWRAAKKQYKIKPVQRYSERSVLMLYIGTGRFFEYPISWRGEEPQYNTVQVRGKEGAC